MIATIARKEITEMIRDGRFRWTAGIVLTLLAGAVLMGWQSYREINAQHETAQRVTREHWLEQGTKNPHSAAHYGVYAFKPKLPLSLVDQGVDPWVGVSAWLEAHKQNEFKYRPAQDATALQRFGELTGATVLQVLVPLLIALLTFSAFSGEREQGTLRQVLSVGARKSDLAAGKALGIAGALGLLLVPATILGVLALAFASENGALLASVPRMSLMAGTYLLYFAALIAVSLGVSALARSSRLALVGLLGFWIFNSLIAPRAVADIAKAVHPTPSSFEFTAKLDAALQEGSEERTRQLREDTLKKYNVDRIEALPVSFSGISLQAGEDHGNEIFDRFYSGLWNTFHQQERVHLASALAAPFLAVRSLSMGLAGTDFAQHAHFATAAEEYRRAIQRELNTDITANAAKVTGTYVQGRELWERIPEFSYQAPSTAWVLARQWPALLLLALWTAAAVLFAGVSTHRLRAE